MAGVAVPQPSGLIARTLAFTAIVLVAGCTAAPSSFSSVPEDIADGPKIGSHGLGSDPTAGSASFSNDDRIVAERYFSGLSASDLALVLPESVRATDLIVGCLREFGIAAEAFGSSIYHPDVEEQRDRDQGLTALCYDAMANRGLIVLDEADSQLLRMRYDAYVVAYECLIDRGISVEAPPSFDTFVEGDAWTPFAGIPLQFDGETNRVTGAGVDCAVP